MTDFEAERLAERYGTSYYAEIDRIDAAKIARQVPKNPGESELVHSMRQNVEEARENRDAVRLRYESAQRDGLFDLDALKSCGKQSREKWSKAIEVQRGDKGRAIAELKHWREYLAWAMAKTGQQTAPDPSPDVRLPPERDDAEEAIPF